MIWPTQRLRDNSQYVVALRQLRNDQGELVKPSEAFVALRLVSSLSKLSGQNPQVTFSMNSQVRVNPLVLKFSD